MKAFILVNKKSDDYTTLPSKYEKHFLFEYMTCRPEAARVDDTLIALRDVLDNATSKDCIVFNGPSWLIALAGYVWFSQENRQHMNILIYDNVTKTYKEYHNEHSL